VIEANAVGFYFIRLELFRGIFFGWPLGQVTGKIGAMKHAILIFSLLTLLGCGKGGEDPDASVMNLFDAAKPADQKILAQLRIAVRKPVGDLTRGDLDKVKVLKVRESEIADLSLFVELRNLEELDLHKNKITDLKPLVKLPNLKKLRVSFNQISDLSPLPEMKALRELKIYNNQVSDLKPLSEMPDLKMVWLMNNNISDVKPLYGLKGLAEVHLNGNKGLNKPKIHELYIALPKCKVVHDIKR